MAIGIGAVKSLGKTISSNSTSLPLNYKLNTVVFAGTVLTSLFAYGYEYDKNGQKVEGTNWSSGNSALLKSLCKYVGYTASGFIASAALCGAPLVIGAPVAVTSLLLGFTVVPELLEKLWPDEGELIKKACSENGISYEPPSLLGSLTGGGTVTA